MHFASVGHALGPVEISLVGFARLPRTTSLALLVSQSCHTVLIWRTKSLAFGTF
jgi:hypothetical protein